MKATMRGFQRASVAALAFGLALASCSAPPASAPVPIAASTRLPAVDNGGEVALTGHFEARGAANMREDAAGACDVQQPFVTPERLDRGYTLVVVGVNGDNSLSAGLAPGLSEGGYPGAVEVVDWTTGFWPLFLYHLRAGSRHRAGAQLIAGKIADYRAHYPGREVNVVGFSAGAVVAAEAVAALGAGQDVDRVVFLAGAVSPLYELRPVLERTRQGVWNYYQPQDVVALWAGTLLAGTADGQHIVSAGAVGFWPRPGSSEAERALYKSKLVQVSYRLEMAADGNLGGHFQCVGRKFVARWIAPLLSGPANGMALQTRSAQTR
jgi:hypothetical protein